MSVLIKENISVLVIEDNIKDFFTIRKYLRKEFKHVKITNTKTLVASKDAILNNDFFDIILLDLYLPDISGKDLVNEIVKIKKDTLVIVLSDCEDKIFVTKLLSQGISDYLFKNDLNASLLHKSIIYNLERKKQSNDLKEFEKKYHTLFDLSPIPMWIVDPTTLKFLNVNKSAIKKYKYVLKEFLSMSLNDIQLVNETEKLNELIKVNKSKIGLLNETNYYRKKNGEIILVEIQRSIIEFDKKQAWLILSIDITDGLKAQQALRNSEHYFKALVQNGVDLITIVDINFNYQYVSPSSKKVIGMHPNNLLGLNAFDFIHKDDRARVFKQYNTLTIKKSIQIKPYRYKHTDNTWVWIETQATNLLDDPIVNGIVSNSRDITLNINYNQKLKQIVERYESIAKATSDAIWDHDFEIGLTYVAGEGFKNILGYNIVNQFAELNFFQSNIHPDDRDLTIKKFEDIVKDPDIIQSELEYRFLKSNGTYAHLKDRFFIIRENGKATRMLGAKQDITNQKIEEERLKLLESVITHSTDSVIITEANPLSGSGPKIVYVNKALTLMTGYSANELIGNTPRMLQGPRTSREELNKVRAALESKNNIESEIINYTKKGDAYWVQMAISNVTNNSGKISHFISIQKDVTNRKQLEQEKEKLIIELIQNNKDLRQFSYITSHNLRGPVANLLGLVSLIDNYKIENKSLKEILIGIKKATVMFDDTIKDLTNVLNIKDQLALPQELISVETVIEKTISQNKIQLNSISANINYKNSSEVLIKFNKAYLESIMFNLFSNAIKYRSPVRLLEILISIEIHEDEFILKFKDNGIGIDTELYKNRIFGLYQRFHDHSEGKGIGLFLIKSQMEVLGGTVTLESKVGLGTTFFLKFKK